MIGEQNSTDDPYLSFQKSQAYFEQWENNLSYLADSGTYMI